MGADIKQLRTRIKSVDSTLHLTSAMGLVASSKIRKANLKMAQSRDYSAAFEKVVAALAAVPECRKSPYISERESGKTVLIAIAGDRGLAGGYNANVLKLAYSQIQNTDAIVLPIGKKSVDFFRTRDVTLMTESCAVAAELSVGRCYSVAKQICSRFLAGEFSEVVLVYTHFASLLAQTPITLPLLPIKISDHKDLTPKKFVLYETGPIAVFNAIVPEYLGGLVYGALCESVASEQAARRMAMDSATKNAEDMIDSLSLQYNRARQGAITQEITEIVAGADSN